MVNHMIPAIEEKRDQLFELCRRHDVKQLELFGSAAVEERFDPERSDLDFLVEFQRSDALDPADQYFGLLDDLRRLFARDVDLVTARSLRNPYFIDAVNATRKVLYAA